MTYIDFCIKSLKYAIDNRGKQRFGQAVFNYLDSVRPDIAEKLCGSDIDCFHKNSVPDDVWAFINSHWTVANG